jgi:hypothetical protein
VKRSNISVRFVFVLAVSVVSLCIAGQPAMPGMPAASIESLHQAAMMGDESAVKKLIDGGTNVNALDNAKMTPLIYAAMRGHANICKMLLAAKADPNAPGAALSPVMAAVRSEATMGAMLAGLPGVTPQYPEVVKILLDAGAPVDGSDRMTGATPLALAVQSGSVAMVEILLEKGASVSKAVGGQSVLEMAEAKARDQARIAELLRAKGGTSTAAATPGPAATPAPTPTERRGPLGRAAMTNRTPYETAPEAVTPRPAAADANEAVILAILADANGVLARARAIPDVNAPLFGVAGVDAKARSEESAWRSRTTDNRAALVRTVERQFDDEMAVVKKIAESEKAKKTASDINDLVAKRQKRYAAISEEMRVQRQTAAAENPATTTRGRGGNMGTGTMGRGRGTMGGMPAEATGTPRPAPVRRNQEANAGAADPSYDSQLQAWSGSNYADKRDLLVTVHELDLKELELLDEVARGEKAEKTSTAIETLMVLRQQRIARIGEAMAKDDNRVQRQQDRGTTTGTRGGRGGMTGQQQGSRGGRY